MKVLFISLLFCSFIADAQIAYNFVDTKKPVTDGAVYPYDHNAPFSSQRKLFQRNTGMIVGLKRGKYTSVEFGGEAHFRKMSLLKPHVVGATINVEYNFENNVLGYHAGVWKKEGRINLTYGADVSYYTDFNNRQRVGIGPSVGFRLLGLHLVNGYTFLTNDNKKSDAIPLPVNTFYMTLRYYFPVENKFTWDRQTMKKKKARKKERANRKKERSRENKKENGNKRVWNIFRKA